MVENSKPPAHLENRKHDALFASLSLDAGGESACWAHLVCPSCGAFMTSARHADCDAFADDDSVRQTTDPEDAEDDDAD